MHWYYTPEDVNSFAYLFVSYVVYDGGYARLGDSETIVLYIILNNQAREMYCDLGGKFYS